MNYFKKMTSILLIQAILLVYPCLIGEDILFARGQNTGNSTLSPQLFISADNFHSFAARAFTNEEFKDFARKQDLLRKAIPGLKDIIKLLYEYKFERVITRYYLTGSFLEGNLSEGQDIDLSVVFRRYDNPEALAQLLRKADEISKKSPFNFHITLEAFGYEYEFENGKFIPTGLKRGEHILSRFEYPEKKSILRLDNIESQLLGEDFFLKLYFLCQKFDFAKSNKEYKKEREAFFKTENINDENDALLTAEERLKVYREDLKSADDEVRLQAALILTKAENGNEETYKIIKDSALNKNLPLSDRVKTHRFLRDEDKEIWTIKEDEEHFSRIESGDRGDFMGLDLPVVTKEEVRNQISTIPGINEKTAFELINIMDKINFKKHELAKLSYGIDYFKGGWLRLLQEKLVEEYGYGMEATNKIIDLGLPENIEIFNPVDYTKAFMVSQELVSQLRAEGITVLSGDEEWLLLEAFVYICKNKYDMQKTKSFLQKKWRETTATTRTIGIFKNLKILQLYDTTYTYQEGSNLVQSDDTNFVSEVAADFIGNTAQQFIYRAYYDGGEMLEYSPGPNYFYDKVSVGIENDYTKKYSSLHVNLGLSWASKFIWAAYLAMHNYINVNTFNGTTYDFYYDQVIRKDLMLFEGQRRVSYIGVQANDLKDLTQIIDIFVVLSILLNNYAERGDEKLAGMWRQFRIEFENVLREQNDEQLLDEFFSQGRMVRFVELVSANNRDNDLYRQLAALIKTTLNKINSELVTENPGKGNSWLGFEYINPDQIKEEEERVIRFLEERLSPVQNLRKLTLANEIALQIKNPQNFELASSGNNLLLENINTGKKLLVTLIPKMVPTSGRKKPSIIREKSFIYIGDKSYEVKDNSIIDEQTGKEFIFKRKHESILQIDLDLISGNDELDAFLKKNPTSQIQKFSQEIFKTSTLLINQAI